MREYKYFVSFCQGVPTRNIICNSIVTFSKKIECLDDILEIEKVLRKKLIEFGESEKTTVKLISITLL